MDRARTVGLEILQRRQIVSADLRRPPHTIVIEAAHTSGTSMPNGSAISIPKNSYTIRCECRLHADAHNQLGEDRPQRCGFLDR
jgi:hypothetical protein